MDTAINNIVLSKGGHDTPADGLCLLEAVAFVRGLPHTDAPTCVSPILGAFGRSLNDVLPDDLRQSLKPLISALPGTADDGHDEARGYLALNWLIRVCTPAWLDLAGLTAEARTLRALSQIVDLPSASRADHVVRAAKAAAEDAVEDAVEAAAWTAAKAAARVASWTAAGDAARVASWTAARVASWTAARVAAWTAAGAAVEDAVRPTVEQLQHSAIELFTAMVDPFANCDD